MERHAVNERRNAVSAKPCEKGSAMITRSCRTKFCRLSTRLVFILLGVLTFGGLLVAPQPASAQGTCIEDVWKAHGNKQGLNCTAQDVTLSSAGNIKISTGGSCDAQTGVCKCNSGQTVTFTADFEMDLTADTRYDVGFYIATGSGSGQNGAVTGQCSATASLAGNTPAGNFINLDPATPPTSDVCGDITGPLGTAHNPLFVTASISTECKAGPSGKLELPFCTTWRQPGSNELCKGTGNGTSTNDVYPGSPSKCNCGTLVVDILVDTAKIKVTKDVLAPGTVPETGGEATYTVKVENTASVADLILDSLADDKYGDITTVHAAGGGFLEVTATTCKADNDPATCQVGQTLPAGGSCTCTFKGVVPAGDAGGTFTDKVTGCGHDNFGHTGLCSTDDAVVTYTDVPEPPKLSKTATGKSCRIDVTYTVVVTNTSAQDKLKLNTLNDDIYGNITQVQGNVINTTCGVAPPNGAGALPFDISPSSNYTCTFVGRISSCNTTVKDTVTGTATDDDGASYTPSDDETVVVTVTP